MPGKITANVTSDVLGGTIDVFPTLASLAGADLPSERSYDGVDLSPVLFDGATERPNGNILFHPDTKTGNITAFRYENYKVFWETYPAASCKNQEGGGGKVIKHNPPLIFDLETDKEESTPVKVSDSTLASMTKAW